MLMFFFALVSIKGTLYSLASCRGDRGDSVAARREKQKGTRHSGGGGGGVGLKEPTFWPSSVEMARLSFMSHLLPIIIFSTSPEACSSIFLIHVLMLANDLACVMSYTSKMPWGGEVGWGVQ